MWIKFFLRFLHAIILLAAAIALIRLSQDNATASRLAQRADSYARSDRNRAYAMALQSLEAWPTNIDAMIVNAQLEYSRGSGDYAVELLEHAIRIADSPGILMRLLGSLWVNNPATMEKGIEMMMRGLRLAPPAGEEARANWSRLGEAAMQSRQFGLAIWAYHRAQSHGYQDEALDRNLSWAYESLALKQGARAR